MMVSNRSQKKTLEMNDHIFPEFQGVLEHLSQPLCNMGLVVPLSHLSNHAELLIYDWSEMGDVEVVVEDIERLNLDDFDPYDPKMRDWRITKEMEWGQQRIL